MSEERTRYLTTEDVRALIAAAQHPAQPEVLVVRTLRDRDLITAEVSRTLEAEIQRSQGNADAILMHVQSNGSIDQRQAVILLADALSGRRMESTVVQRAADVAMSTLAIHAEMLTASTRNSKDREVSVEAFEVVCGSLNAAPSEIKKVAVSVGKELVTKIASSRGEILSRKRLTLRVIFACSELEATSISQIIEAALSQNIVHTYDIVHNESAFCQSIKDPAAVQALATRANTEADLSAAVSVVSRITNLITQGKYVRILCKQYGDNKKPTLDDVQNMKPGLDALVELHVAAPATSAASHDEALLRRWAAIHPSEAKGLISAADKIGTARAPFTERFKKERVASERTSIAKRFVKESIIPAKQIVLLVGGSYSHDVVAAFNELHSADPVWGDWIFKERSQTIKIGEIDEAVGSVRCAGVVIIARPAGHTVVEQAKVAVTKHSKQHIVIHNSSKTALREGLTSLLVELASARAVA